MFFPFQLDEDVRLLVQRFDADSADETGKESEWCLFRIEVTVVTFMF